MDVKTSLRSLCAALVAVAALAPGAAGAQAVNYVVGPQDVLAINVFDQPDLSGKYTVEADGTFTFPLIGRLKAGGLTLRGIEDSLKRELANGFFRNPQLSVAVQEYRSQRIFIVGEVRNPGTYALTGDMSLIEALARAGSATEYAGGEALIVRSRLGQALQGPVLPGQEADAEVIRVDIKLLQSGQLSQNAALHDNDTIFVPRAELVFVFGQVKNPSAYPLQKGMTVLQALSLAGGVTDRGSTSRIQIVRLVNGQRTEINAKVDDIVAPGDTVIVKERFF